MPKFIGHLAEGQFHEAYETIREANVLTAICGYVCPSEVQCGVWLCKPALFNARSEIRQLQQWISQNPLDEGWVSAARPFESQPLNSAIAIGAGPAGVAAAAALAQQGYHVALMDKNPASGSRHR